MNATAASREEGQRKAQPKEQHLQVAKRTLALEIAALQALPSQLNVDFARLVDAILALEGHVVVMGMGKSGHIGRKISASLASTGTPSFFVHPSEAGHGDLGMITQRDLVLVISNSGEQDDLNLVMPLLRRQGVMTACITANAHSSLAKAATLVLLAAAEREACPHNLAPTSSTLLQLAMGDALVVACLAARDFSREDFARAHPSGALGRRLLTRVEDVMQSAGQDGGKGIGTLPLPVVRREESLLDVMQVMSRGGLGFAICLRAEGSPLGIFTDGDLRRALLQGVDMAACTMEEVMHLSPITIDQKALAVDALSLMEQHKTTSLLATDEAGKLAGALNMNMLLRAKIV